MRRLYALQQAPLTVIPIQYLPDIAQSSTSVNRRPVCPLGWTRLLHVQTQPLGGRAVHFPKMDGAQWNPSVTPKDWRVASFNDEKTPACYDSGGLLCAGLMAWLSLTRSYFRITKLDGIPDRQLYVS